METHDDTRSLLVAADSYLSWILHRYDLEETLKKDIEALIPKIRKVTG